MILNSGQSFRLTGSNDVDDGNRGILITHPERGRVIVEWEDFEKLTLTKDIPTMPAYSDYEVAKPIRGTITTGGGKSFTGRIVYDLDEYYQFEILDGEKGDTKFKIPFKNIKTIKPLNSGKSNITLRNGEEYLLEDTQDVSYDHTGIILFEGEDDSNPIYISWESVELIELQ